MSEPTNTIPTDSLTRAGYHERLVIELDRRDPDLETLVIISRKLLGHNLDTINLAADNETENANETTITSSSSSSSGSRSDSASASDSRSTPSSTATLSNEGTVVGARVHVRDESRSGAETLEQANIAAVKLDLLPQ
ncbi:hypothetical protein BJX70DRAFT_124489 [Aspergillus crustosus]